MLGNWKEGKSKKDIAGELGVGENTVRRWFKSLEIQSRSRTEYISQAYVTRPELREKASRISRKRFEENPELRVEASRRVKAYLSDPDNYQRRLEQIGRIKPPTALEIDFDSLTPKNIEYVGDGKFWRQLPNQGARNPGFIVQPFETTRTVIELHGDYWHKGEDEQRLIDQYAQIGITCLVVWEKDFRADPEGVVASVLERLRAEGVPFGGKYEKAQARLNSLTEEKRALVEKEEERMVLLEQIVQQSPNRYDPLMITRVKGLVEYKIANPDKRTPHRFLEEPDDFVLYHKLHPEWQGRSTGEMRRDQESGANAFYQAFKDMARRKAKSEQERKRIMHQIFRPRLHNWESFTALEDWRREFEKHPEWQGKSPCEMA